MELETYKYQGILKDDAKLNFGSNGVTLEKGYEYAVMIVKISKDVADVLARHEVRRNIK